MNRTVTFTLDGEVSSLASMAQTLDEYTLTALNQTAWWAMLRQSALFRFIEYLDSHPEFIETTLDNGFTMPMETFDALVTHQDLDTWYHEGYIDLVRPEDLWR